MCIYISIIYIYKYKYIYIYIHSCIYTQQMLDKDT